MLTRVQIPLKSAAVVYNIGIEQVWAIGLGIDICCYDYELNI